MKDKTFDKIINIALIVIGSVFLVICTIGGIKISNSLFGNPITKKNVENTVLLSILMKIILMIIAILKIYGMTAKMSTMVFIFCHQQMKK